jgi:predicted RNA-binding Zn ribbon-like protein
MIGVMSVAGENSIPPTLVLVRDFVNTVEWQTDAESWRSPADLADWLSENTGWPRDDLSDDDLALARKLREGLRSVLLMHAGHAPFATAIDELGHALRLIPLHLSFDASGAIALTSSAGSGVAQPLSRVLEAVDAARVDGSWTRLKACSRDSCRWAYWDDSRNRSGRWCSMSGCGNYIKMRRRNGHADGAVEEIIAHGAHRVPTMVDVAALAGVSIKTVSNVVTGSVNVADATRARVTAAIQELDYHPNLAARALAKGRVKAALNER